MGTPWAFMTPEQRKHYMAKGRVWRAANRERVRTLTRAQARAWRAANLDKARAQERARYSANPEKFRAAAWACEESKRRARMALTLLAIGGTK